MIAGMYISVGDIIVIFILRRYHRFSWKMSNILFSQTAGILSLALDAISGMCIIMVPLRPFLSNQDTVQYIGGFRHISCIMAGSIQLSSQSFITWVKATTSIVYYQHTKVDGMVNCLFRCASVPIAFHLMMALFPILIPLISRLPLPEMSHSCSLILESNDVTSMVIVFVLLFGNIVLNVIAIHHIRKVWHVINDYNKILTDFGVQLTSNKRHGKAPGMRIYARAVASLFVNITTAVVVLLDRYGMVVFWVEAAFIFVNLCPSLIHTSVYIAHVINIDHHIDVDI